MLNDLLTTAERGIDSNLTGPWVVLAVSWGWAFLSALARLMGLFVLSPVFGQRGVSVWLRAGLAVCLSVVIAPLLLSRKFATVPSDGWDAGTQLGGEFVMGALLGFGVLFVFAALKLAGELIDQQAGAAVQEVFDPLGTGTSTLSGQLLTVVGTLSLLCAGPGNGHLQIVATLLDSFEAIPAQAVWSGEGAVVWIGYLGRQSLSLALQVAAPVLAAGVIVSWGIAASGGGARGGPVSTTLFGLPLRVALSLVILTVCLTGMTDVFIAQLEALVGAFPDLVRPS